MPAISKMTKGDCVRMLRSYGKEVDPAVTVAECRELLKTEMEKQKQEEEGDGGENPLKGMSGASKEKLHRTAGELGLLNYHNLTRGGLMLKIREETEKMTAGKTDDYIGFGKNTSLTYGEAYADMGYRTWAQKTAVENPMTCHWKLQRFANYSIQREKQEKDRELKNLLGDKKGAGLKLDEEEYLLIAEPVVMSGGSKKTQKAANSATSSTSGGQVNASAKKRTNAQEGPEKPLSKQELQQEYTELQRKVAGMEKLLQEV